jgi:serine/threonine protein kinase
VPESQKCATRIAVVEETIAEPKDIEEYKATYENIILVGSGTYGSVYYVKWDQRPHWLPPFFFPFSLSFSPCAVSFPHCRERETGDCAAAKYLRQEKIKVRAEAAVLRSLIQSAFVVQLVGLFESPLNSVLVTEYLAGGDLITRTAPDDYCLTERKCQIFIRQIVRGVQFIHSQRILHLDLKPFNIMFANPDDDYNLRIIDFGLAENMDKEENWVKMTMCGTLEFMSPEVMDCKFASPASDMWYVALN